ncbi:MAG: hypothetical protein ACF8XB_12300, partial [Planctomycetota bacterium JB042]
MKRSVRHHEKGAALVVVVIFTFLAISGAMLFLDRTQVELRDGRQKAASVRSLFGVHSGLARAHLVINEEAVSAVSQSTQQNPALVDPEVVGGKSFVPDTNRMVEVRTVKPNDQFDENGAEVPPVGGYEALPPSWFVLESKVYEPLATLSDGSTKGSVKLVRQYVRDGTPLSNNFVAVVDDDLGLGGAPVNPGKPAEGEIHTNKHLYIMTANPYYAHRLMAVDGVSYTAGAVEEDTVYLHPENNFEADPLYLPLPEHLTSNPDPSSPDDHLKGYAEGTNPQSVWLNESNPDYSITMNGISDASELKMAGGDPDIEISVNFGADGTGPSEGLLVEGNVDSELVLEGATVQVKLVKADDPSKWMLVEGLPTPQNGVLFFDTAVDSRRTTLQGEVTTRTTLATTGNIDVVGSVRYYDDEGDPATKLVHSDDLDGLDESEYGLVDEIDEADVIGTSDSVEYFANERPYGVEANAGDGFYDGDSVLGVVAAQDIILMSDVPENAEIAGAYLSLEKRLTLEGMGYDSNGNLTYIDGSNDFYTYNGARSSIRRFGGLISFKRPATAVVTYTGSFLYGFRRGFSLFDEKMKQQPPPFFPKDR